MALLGRAMRPQSCHPDYRNLAAATLFRRCDLFNWHCFRGLLGLLIRFLQELIDHAGTLLFFDLLLLRLPLFLEEPVVYFPAHRVLHP